MRASTEPQKSEHSHCWRQTLRLRGVLFHPASEKEIVRDVTEKRLLHRVFIATQSPNRFPQRRRLFVISQRNVCYIVFSSRHRAQIDCRREGDCSWCHRETFATSCFHRDTEPKSIAAEKEIVRDFTEKRLLHRVFITTQSPNRLPQRRRLFVVSQRNVCYIVFSSRHRAQIDCRREGDCS